MWGSAGKAPCIFNFSSIWRCLISFNSFIPLEKPCHSLDGRLGGSQNWSGCGDRGRAQHLPIKKLWRWRQYGPQKYSTTSLHSVTTHKTCPESCDCMIQQSLRLSFKMSFRAKMETSCTSKMLVSYHNIKLDGVTTQKTLMWNNAAAKASKLALRLSLFCDCSVLPPNYYSKFVL